MKDIDRLIDALIKMRDSMDYVGSCEGVYFDQEENMMLAERIIYETTGQLWEELTEIKRDMHSLYNPEEDD